MQTYGILRREQDRGKASSKNPYLQDPRGVSFVCWQMARRFSGVHKPLVLSLVFFWRISPCDNTKAQVKSDKLDWDVRQKTTGSSNFQSLIYIVRRFGNKHGANATY